MNDLPQCIQDIILQYTHEISVHQRYTRVLSQMKALGYKKNLRCCDFNKLLTLFGLIYPDSSSEFTDGSSSYYSDLESYLLH
jgi:hypothetical protein